MASSESMDDSFKVRAEKIFGSLTSSSSQQPSSLQSTLWSLTGDEVERRQWRRGDADADADADAADRDETPCSSSFDELKKDRRRYFCRVLEEDIHELQDDDEEESNSLRSRRGGADGMDEWDIRSSIGLDSTLDNEEEEDEYDKVASGRENDGDRLYMKNVTNQESVIPESLHSSRDLRANRMAAKIRLREDEDDARNLNSLHGSDTEDKELHVKLKASHESASQLRSILKRKDSNSDSKSCKRVRFDPGCKIVSKEESNEEILSISMGSSSDVPDYLRHPSKYARYSFNSSIEVEEKSNSQASMDFLKLVKVLKSTGSESDCEDASSNLPKSVTFIPKKKAGGLSSVNYSSKVKQDEDDDNQSLQHIALPVDIAAGESQKCEASVMEEDEPGTNATVKSAASQKSGRKYRIKSDLDESTP